MSGPFTISNCTDTAVVVAPLFASKFSNSSSSSDPNKTPRGPRQPFTGKKAVMEHVQFENNSGTKGGGVRVGAGRLFALQHAVFRDNKAEDGAAILLEEGALLRSLLYSKFEGNR